MADPRIRAFAYQPAKRRCPPACPLPSSSCTARKRTHHNAGAWSAHCISAAGLANERAVIALRGKKCWLRQAWITISTGKAWRFQTGTAHRTYGPWISRMDGWLERRISLKNKHGLHMRPAQKIVETAARFQCDVRVRKDHLDLNAKSILDMIDLAAYMVNRAAQNDSEFAFLAQGADAPQALEALENLINSRFYLE